MASERIIKKSVLKHDSLWWIQQANCFLYPYLRIFVFPLGQGVPLSVEVRENRGRTVQREKPGPYHEGKFRIFHVFSIS